MPPSLAEAMDAALIARLLNRGVLYPLL